MQQSTVGLSTWQVADCSEDIRRKLSWHGILPIFHQRFWQGTVCSHILDFHSGYYVLRTPELSTAPPLPLPPDCTCAVQSWCSTTGDEVLMSVTGKAYKATKYGALQGAHLYLCPQGWVEIEQYKRLRLEEYLLSAETSAGMGEETQCSFQLHLSSPLGFLQDDWSATVWDLCWLLRDVPSGHH